MQISIWIKIFFKYHRNPSNIANNSPVKDEEIAINLLFEKYSGVFQRIMSNILTHYMNGENLNNYISETFFGLMKIYNAFYINLVNTVLYKFDNVTVDKSKFYNVKNAFEKLSTGISEVHDQKSIVTFAKKLSDFYIEINNLI